MKIKDVETCSCLTISPNRLSRAAALAALVGGEEFTPATAAALLAAQVRLGTVAGDLAALGDLGPGDCAGALALLLPGAGQVLEVREGSAAPNPAPCRCCAGCRGRRREPC